MKETKESITGPSSKRGRIAVYYLTYLTNGILALITGTLLPYLREAYQISYASSGVMLSMHSIGALAAGFLAGALPAKCGQRQTLLSMISFYALSFLVLILGGNPLLLAIGFLFTGIARGVQNHFNNEQLNRYTGGAGSVMNGMHAFFALGALLTPLLTLFFAQRMGDYRYLCVFLAIVGLVDLVVYAKLPIIGETAKKEKGNRNTAFFGDREFWLLSLFFFLTLAAEQGVIGWLITYLSDTGIVSASLAQMTASLLWGSILAGRLLAAYLCTKMRKEILLFGMSIGMMGFFGILLMARTGGVVILSIIGFGLFIAGIYPTTTSCAGGLMRRYPLSWAYMLTFGNLGNIVMPIVIGAVANALGIRAGIATIAAAIAGSIVIAVLLVKNKSSVRV